MSTVAFQGISKSFGAVSVLQALDLEIGDGEFVVLLGPSGCGKTTLLNILAGLTEQTSGRVLINGRDVSHLDPKDRDIAMVFQSYALYPTKTVRGNLKFGLDARGLSRDEINRRIIWVARLLQIEALLDRKPSELSGGQRQRVAIGRALVKQVGVCLFDEPLSNLDAKLRTEMRMEIKKLHGELQNTVVYVTHDQVEAMTMATKIAVMDKGIIQQIGTPDQIYEDPQSLFVAEFVGSPSMNFVNLVVGERGGRLTAYDEAEKFAVDVARFRVRSPLNVGQRVRVGIRPEHVRVGGAGDIPAGAVRVELRPRYFERLGPEAIAFLDLPTGVMAARLVPEQVAELQHSAIVPVTFPIDRINVFDVETGRRL
jgi:multiple sugar transport system ATP-binding protein